MNPSYVRGDLLPMSLRREVLKAYIYRWTVDNPRRAEVYGTCPVCGVPGGRPDMSDAGIPCRQHHPTVALQTDEEWLATTYFACTKDGKRLDRRVRGCVSFVR